MKKIITIFIILLAMLVGFMIFREIKIPSMLLDEYFIINYENDNKELSKEEENELISFLNTDSYTIQESDNVKITKLAYQHPFRHESSCYIFFRTDVDVNLQYTLIDVTENYKEYVREHICANTNWCEEFKCVRKIVGKSYIWWENNEKRIKYERIEEPYQEDKLQIEKTQEEKNDNLVEEISTGEFLTGKIIEITDKYLKVQKDANNIKLVEIDQVLNKLTNTRTREPIEVEDIKVGDYFFFNTIARNIEGQELINESLKSIVKDSTTLLFTPEKIISVEKKKDYYIAKMVMLDATAEWFERENDKYEIDFIINNNTEFYPEGKDLSALTIKDICEGYITTIYVDENSIGSENPIITVVDVYDI